jgi:hypothetical protein
MLSHIVSDLHEAYVTEILKPQLGKPGASSPKSASGESSAATKDPQEQSVKRIRQAVYDIRYRSRREGIGLDQAFNQYMSHTSMSANEKTEVRDKLGIGPGASASSVKEEIVDEDAKAGEYYLRVVPKRGTGERPYTRRFDPNRLQDRQKRHKLQTRGIKTYLTKHGQPYEGPSKPSLDQDGDGDNDFADVMSARMQASGMSKDAANKKVENKPYNKKKKVSEEYSNWRQDLREIADEISNKGEKEIKEKKVNNKIVINPEFKENTEILGGHILESFELNEEYLNETANVAAEFFYNCGLNENGIDIVIEELGEEKFTEFVFDLVEEYFLSEERAAKKRKSGKSYDEIKAEIDAKEAARKKITADKTKNAVEKAKETQEPSSKKPTKQGIGGRIMSALKSRAEKDIAARKEFMSAARETGKTIRKAATHVGGVAREAGKGASGAVKFTGAVAKELTKEELELQEKAESEQQQKLFGLALSVKRGETPRSEASAEVLKIVDTMSEKKIRDFAKTPHSEVPKKKVNEAIANIPGRENTPPRTKVVQSKVAKTQLRNAQDKMGIGEDFDVSTLTPQELQLRKQKASIEKRLSDIRQRTVRQQKANKPTQQNQNQEF